MVEITMESGLVEYICEKQGIFGDWKVMKRDLWIGPCIIEVGAIFSSKDDALRYIRKHPDQIIKSKEVIAE